jgi:hypothetical protein
MRAYTKKVIGFSVIAILLIALFVSLFFFSPNQIVDELGVTNSYILLFFISFFGGFSSGGSITFIATLTTLAVAGLNPLVLGIIAGTALAIGDIIMFLVALRGRHLIKGKTKKKIDKFSNKIKGKAGKFIPFIAYLYIGFTPLPNDLMILSLAAIDQPKKSAIIPIIIGDLTFAILFAILASIGISWFF